MYLGYKRNSISELRVSGFGILTLKSAAGKFTQPSRGPRVAPGSA